MQDFEHEELHDFGKKTVIQKVQIGHAHMICYNEFNFLVLAIRIIWENHLNRTINLSFIYYE